MANKRKRNKFPSGWGTGKLTTDEAAKALNISRVTITRWRKEGILEPIKGLYPPSLKVEPLTYYSEEAVKALMSPEQLEALETQLATQEQKPEYVQYPLTTSDRASAA